ncbi:MAG: type II toxin-antitoxin system HipA family toxin [Anaerovoracaceae bacterium]
MNNMDLKFEQAKILEVFYSDRKVGTLALHENAVGAFQYDKEWQENGFSISPLSLPLTNKVFIPKWLPFQGLFGVFSDSLPDGWGRLLLDRYLTQNRIDINLVDELSRLALTGREPKGALQYYPNTDLEISTQFSLDVLAKEAIKIYDEHPYRLNKENEKALKKEELIFDTLINLGSSAGGARPKIMIKIDKENWIIKFPTKEEGKDAGKMEYDYALAAKQCGIEMTETKLFSSKTCAGYFGIKRFDRDENDKKLHVISASGLLERPHYPPSLDYNDLMNLTLQMTRDFSEVEKLFRIMCFNVYSHNRDDHGKNFSFLYDEDNGIWKLTPAYDLTYSNSIYGEHATSVNGEGKNPSTSDIIEVAAKVGYSKRKAKIIAKEIEEIVKASLSKYME